MIMPRHVKNPELWALYAGARPAAKQIVRSVERSYRTKHAPGPNYLDGRFHRWPDKRIAQLFNVIPAGSGKGELALVATMLNVDLDDVELDGELTRFLSGFLGGSNSTYDIDMKSDMFVKDTGDKISFRPEYRGLWEVKEPAGGKVRVESKGITSISSGRRIFNDVANDLMMLFDWINRQETARQDDIRRAAASALDDDVDVGMVTLRAIEKFSIGKVNKDDVFSGGAQAIIDGNLSRGRVLGSMGDDVGSRPRQRIGLLQVVEELSKLLESADNDMRDVASKFLGGPVFRDPMLIKEKFEKLSDLRVAFAGVKGVILVSHDGFKAVLARDYDVNFRFDSVSKARPRFHVMKFP
jgi:hypothetical protein